MDRDNNPDDGRQERRQSLNQSRSAGSGDSNEWLQDQIGRPQPERLGHVAERCLDAAPLAR
jgi:hypothetical protein